MKAKNLSNYFFQHDAIKLPGFTLKKNGEFPKAIIFPDEEARIWR